MALNNSPGVQVIMKPAAVQAFIRSPDGPILRSLIRRATIVQEAAKKQVRLGHVGGGERGTKGAQGNLRYSIVKRIIPPDSSTGAPYLRVGSNVRHAYLHHEGTRPHIILPKQAKALRFYFPKAGGFVFSQGVHHPGTKPNRYLTDNLHLAAR